LLKDIKNTISQSAVYGLSRISTKLVAFILLPLLTESLWQILWAVFLFGFESGIVRWYLEIKDKLRQKRFLFSVSIFLLVFNLILTAVIYLFSEPVSKIVYEQTGYGKFVMYACFIAIVETFSFVIFLLLRIEEKAKAYSALAVITTLISLVMQIYFLQYTAIKLEGVFLSKIIAPLIIIIVLLPYFIRHISFSFEKTLMKELLTYSFPIMIASLVITLLNQVDRYILGSLTNLTDVGIYGLASNVSGLINFLVISPFSLAFTVLSWKKLNDTNAKRFYTKTTTYLFLAVTYISMVIALFTPHLIKIFTLKTDYWIASAYVPWIIIAMPFYGIHFVGVFSFYVTKNTRYVLLSYLAALIVKIVLDFALIPAYGIYGAAAANFTSFFLLCAVIYLFSKSNYFFEYEWGKIIWMLVIYFALTLPFFYFTFENRIVEILLKFGASAVFPLLLYITRFYEPAEIIAVKGFLNKYLFRKRTK
jgi:O-antigen/teichoic acid export membrane protein